MSALRPIWEIKGTYFRDQVLLQNLCYKSWAMSWNFTIFVWEVSTEKKQRVIDFHATLEVLQNRNLNVMGPLSKQLKKSDSQKKPKSHLT